MAELEPAFLVAEFPNPEPMLAATKALREDWIGGGGLEIAWFPFFSF